MRMLTVSLLVCAVPALTGAAAVPAAENNDHGNGWLTLCPSGWTGYNGHCYLYVAKPQAWIDAEKNCQSLDGNLASVHSSDEQQLIQSLILWRTQEYPETWLGGSDAIKEGVWLWSDGTPFNFYCWSTGQPDNGQGGEDCLMMNHGAQRKFNDLPCSDKLPSVCIKKPWIFF